MTSSVIAMANTPSENASSLPVSFSSLEDLPAVLMQNLPEAVLPVV